MAKNKYDLEPFLILWGTWCWLFENGEHGWPEESMIYKFMREGCSAEKNKVRKSQAPFKHNDKAERINKLVNDLKAIDSQKAEALYLYYVHKLDIKKYAHDHKIVPRTVYKRIDAAREWISRYF